MKPNIFVVGPSGSGKSSSLRNLNPETTIILNTEQKALPFRGSNKFKLNVPIANMEEFHLAFEKAIVSTIADTIVIESFTSMVEQQFISSGKSYSGFDLWADYQAEIRRILNRSKSTNKYIIFLGIDHIFEGVNGVEERCIAVQGALKKQIEKEFVIVLFTDMISNEKGVAEYRFITNKQKGYEHTGVKSPMEMLPLTMSNDLAEVISLANAYYAEDPATTS
jgi:hypothetical protein